MMLSWALFSASWMILAPSTYGLLVRRFGISSLVMRVSPSATYFRSWECCEKESVKALHPCSAGISCANVTWRSGDSGGINFGWHFRPVMQARNSCKMVRYDVWVLGAFELAWRCSFFFVTGIRQGKIAVKARKPFMSVTSESAGLKVAGVCYAMGFSEASPESDDDDSWSNTKPDSEGWRRCWFPHCWMHHHHWFLGGLR